MGDVWLWARPRRRVATLVAVGAADATWANLARLWWLSLPTSFHHGQTGAGGLTGKRPPPRVPWEDGPMVQQGIVPASAAVDDRLIAAHGLSRPAAERRKDSRLRGRTLGPVSVVDASERLPYDRGHAIGHALGGVLDLNIIPQARAVNRGGIWRQMERYCQEHLGTYFFCRPIYAGLSSHPKEIEFGVLRSDGSMWAHTFRNYGRIEELETFERLYREKIASPEKSS
jgi:hypothetical protein